MKDLSNLALFAEAVAFAAEKHRHQRRKDTEASPYINHPIALARILIVEGRIEDVDTVCGAILHDTIEDTDTTREELCVAFGESVASVVVEVTDDKALPKGARKAAQVQHAPSLSRAAKLVKLADKIANLQDILQRPPAEWSRERKSAYFNWAASVVDGLRGVHPGLEAKFDELLAEGRATFT
jgi:guanosine-3',5'-bis(diphosphate) 3'-pyrophosphohydrolase